MPRLPAPAQPSGGQSAHSTWTSTSRSPPYHEPCLLFRRHPSIPDGDLVETKPFVADSSFPWRNGSRVRVLEREAGIETVISILDELTEN